MIERQDEIACLILAVSAALIAGRERPRLAISPLAAGAIPPARHPDLAAAASRHLPWLRNLNNFLT